MSSFTIKSHSSEDFHKVFLKLHFEEVEEKRGIRYYQDPDGAIQTLQVDTDLDKPYIEDKLAYIGMSYRVFRWLLS